MALAGTRMDQGLPCGNNSVDDMVALVTPGSGITPLAAMNIAMGNATYSGDPDFPLTPVCALEAETCDRPIRLEGIPISWGTRTLGTCRVSRSQYRRLGRTCAM